MPSSLLPPKPIKRTTQSPALPPIISSPALPGSKQYSVATLPKLPDKTKFTQKRRSDSSYDVNKIKSNIESGDSKDWEVTIPIQIQTDSSHHLDNINQAWSSKDTFEEKLDEDLGDNDATEDEFNSSTTTLILNSSLPLDSE